MAKKKPIKSKPAKRRRPTTSKPEWIVPLNDTDNPNVYISDLTFGTSRATAVLELSTDGDVRVVVRLAEYPGGGRLLTLSPIAACQLGLALTDASRAAGARRAILKLKGALP